MSAYWPITFQEYYEARQVAYIEWTSWESHSERNGLTFISGLARSIVEASMRTRRVPIPEEIIQISELDSE